MDITNQNGDTIAGVERKKGLSTVKGLMFREEGRALLEFSHQDFHSIWMLFVRFPLDLAFVDGDRRIVSITRDVPPVTFDPRTWKVYRPAQMCTYVLEVESGLLDEKGFEKGDRLTFGD